MKLALLFICLPLCGASLTEAVASVCLANSKLPDMLLAESDAFTVIPNVVYLYFQFSELARNTGSPIFTHLSFDNQYMNYKKK
jgi:hypothetical protein